MNIVCFQVAALSYHGLASYTFQLGHMVSALPLRVSTVGRECVVSSAGLGNNNDVPGNSPCEGIFHKLQ